MAILLRIGLRHEQVFIGPPKTACLALFPSSPADGEAVNIMVTSASNKGRIVMKTTVLLAGALFSAFLTAGASAETITYKAELKGSQEVPANDSKGSGTATLSYDTATKTLKWKVTYSGLSGPATAAHLHGPAEAGKNAGVVIGFAKPDSPIEGSATLTDAQAADLAAGKLYINVHTAANKGGEIRGQLTGK